jgi:photosynthetic reaction center cytochrome c subunit
VGGMTKLGIFKYARAGIVAALFVICGLLLERVGVAQTSTPAPLPTQPAEQVFKNIQALKGTPASDLQGTMSFIASSLGVDCDYCHVQAFESDTAPAKVRAREMIRMTQRINQETFHGGNVVNCFTCHQGGSKPISIATVLTTGAARPAAQTAATLVGAALPSLQTVLDDYVKALGGQAALDAVKTRVIMTAPLGRASTDKSTEERDLKAPGKVLLQQLSPGYSLWAGYNGQHGWAQDSLKSYWGMLNTSQLHSLIRDAEMYPGSRIRSEYKNTVVSGREKVADRDAIVVSGISPEGTREKFYFDARTNLLVRRHIEEPTTFGWFPLETSYEGYREVDGVKIPFVVRISSAGGAWGVRTSYMVLEVRQNVPIEDEKFEHAPVEK